MKKFLAVALICALAVSYAACTTDSPSLESENEDFIVNGDVSKLQIRSDNYSKDVAEAIEILCSYSADDLDLPTEFKDYSLMPDETYQTIDGEEYVAISAFSDLGDRMYNNGVFYVRVSDKTAFKNDYLTGNMTAINSNEVIINE